MDPPKRKRRNSRAKVGRKGGKEDLARWGAGGLALNVDGLWARFHHVPKKKHVHDKRGPWFWFAFPCLVSFSFSFSFAVCVFTCLAALSIFGFAALFGFDARRRLVCLFFFLSVLLSSQVAPTWSQKSGGVPDSNGRQSSYISYFWPETPTIILTLSVGLSLFLDVLVRGSLFLGRSSAQNRKQKTTPE